MTEAVAVLREMQNLNRNELYLYSEYDPQIYYPKLLAKESFAAQIRMQLYTAFEEHNKLPAVIVIILGNKDLHQKVFNPEGTRKVWGELFKLIDRAIKQRKEDLPAKAKVDDEPRVFTTNLFPKYKEHNEQLDSMRETFKTKRRRFNGLLPQISQKYGFGVLPINGIIPDQSEFFVTATGVLSGLGLKEFWTSVSKELKFQDIKFKESKTNSVIKAHYDQLRENRKIQRERAKTSNDRLSLPRTQFDRGDGFRADVSRIRANSVPAQRNHSGKGIRNKLN